MEDAEVTFTFSNGNISSPNGSFLAVIQGDPGVYTHGIKKITVETGETDAIAPENTRRDGSFRPGGSLTINKPGPVNNNNVA